MALLGTGAICIWNGIAPEGRADFYDWHSNEHMPERAAVPGFLRARRFIAADAETSPEFFTLYETRDPSVHAGKTYLARLNAPTDWTRRATQAFRETSRALTRVAHSFGAGAGGIIATARFPVRPGREADAEPALGAALEQAARLPRVTGAHLCITDEAASAGRSAESRDRADILAAHGWIVLIEAADAEAARAGFAALNPVMDKFGGESLAAGRYRLEFQC